MEAPPPRAAVLNKVVTQTRLSIQTASTAGGIYTAVRNWAVDSRNQPEETPLPPAGQLQPATNNQVPACFNPYTRSDLRLTNPFSIFCLTRNSDSFLVFASALCSSLLSIKPFALFHSQKRCYKTKANGKAGKSRGDVSRERCPSP